MGSFTNTSGGLREMMNSQFTPSRDRADFPNIAIVITDGESNLDQIQTIPDAVQARAEGIEIVTLGITDLVNLDEVRLMSSLPQEENKNWFRIESFQVLNSVSMAVRDAACVNIKGKYIFIHYIAQNTIHL